MMCAYSLREANARRVTRSSRPAVELLPERHSAPLQVVGLAPLATAGVLQALHDPSNPPGVRLPQRVGCVVHVVSLASQLLGPGPACLEGLRGGQFFGKSFGNNERAHIDRLLGPAEAYRVSRTSGGRVRRSCPTPSLPPPASPRRGAPPRSGTSRLGRGSVRWYGSGGWRSRRDTRALGAAVRAGESRRRGRYTGRGSRIGRRDGSTRARVRRIAPPRDGRAPERASRASVSTWPSSTPVAGACVRRP